MICSSIVSALVENYFTCGILLNDCKTRSYFFCIYSVSVNNRILLGNLEPPLVSTVIFLSECDANSKEARNNISFFFII